jgi:glycosyltransferase involved in cell wall biosynthesis
VTGAVRAPARPRLRVAQVAPPLERVPPTAYGGTERVIDALRGELLARGHAVTTFASGDSEVRGEAVVTVPRALRPAGSSDDPAAWYMATILDVRDRAEDFDVVHLHLDVFGAPVADALDVPVVHSFHGRLDLPGYDHVLSRMGGRMVAISRSQASSRPDVQWAAVIHNGLAFGPPPNAARGDGLAFVGRVDAEKGIVEAMEIARLSGRPLRIAAKVGTRPPEIAYHEEVFLPALRRAGRDVEFLGELSGADRDQLLAESFASLMPITWPEPFGLAAIESLACGTPVLACPLGALPEILRDGVDGFLGVEVEDLAARVDDCGRLDRADIAASVRERFSAARMADAYEALYAEAAALEDRGAARS